MTSALQLGRYRLGPRLARGGMGEVYPAVQLGLGRFEKPLAIKLLLPHLCEEPAAVEMFLEEARLAARMNHPNVVQIFDVGNHPPHFFIAMELVQGVSLSSLNKGLLARRMQLPAGVLLRIAHDLAQGLEHVHAQRDEHGQDLQLVHRDVSPQNVLVSIHGEVKLSDFGIAKTRGSLSHTLPGTTRGKPEYLAPEQITGETVDARADLFAAAITLVHAATQVSPFRRDNDGATLHAVQKQDLGWLADARPDLPAELVTALQRAAAKDPTERFADVTAFRRALPEAPEGSRAALGQLVRESCGTELQLFEEKTQKLTDAATPAQRETLFLGPALRTRRRWPLLGIPLALGLGAVGFFSASSEHRPPVLAPVPHAASAPEVRTVMELDTVQAPVPAPPPEARASRRPVASRSAGGFVTVDAKPWAEVFWKGKKIGDTPLSSFPVDAGRVTLRLVNPELKKSIQKTVEVRANRTTFVKADLQ